MYYKLKYILIISYLVCATSILSCCSADTPDETDNGKGKEVSFDVQDRSRASMATAFDRFVVYGDMKYVGETSTLPIIIFNKTEVVKTDNGWTYQGARYWFNNHEHSFVAICPLSVLEAEQYSGSTLSFTYTLPESNDEVADILAATHRRLYIENGTNHVTKLQFGHLLTMINFTLELTEPTTRSEECFKIHKLEMSGFGTSATINITPASIQSNHQTDDSEIDIVTTPGSGSLAIRFDEPIEVINGAAAVEMFDSDNAIIMLPQALEGNDKVQISLTYTSNDEAEETQVSASLSNFKWERGRSYNYKIKLELEQKEVNMVISNAIIAPWNLVEDHNQVDAR